MKKEIVILLLAAFLWCAGIVLAPLFALYEFPGISKFIYSFYGVVCHQFDSHSFHIGGYSFAVCIRCTSIYYSFFIGVIALKIGLRWNKNFIISLIFISAPMVIDAMLNTFGIVQSSNFSRIVTGAVFGFGSALLLAESLLQAVKISLSQKIFTRKKYADKT